MRLKSRYLKKKGSLILLIAILLITQTAVAQKTNKTSDTLHLSVDSAENMFLIHNFALLSQKFNIDANQALVIQAKLWPNPNLSVQRGTIIPINEDGVKGTFFNNSENSWQLQQLFLLAGKRNKQIKLAEANVKLAEAQFYDLLRTLKYTLRSDFYNIYYLKKSAAVYDKEINALLTIVKAYETQKGKDFVSGKDVALIKAQYYAFTSEYNDLINQINDTESELRMVLQSKPGVFIDPLVDTASVAATDVMKYPVSALIDSAYKNRTDLTIAKVNTDIARLNLNYQKALAVPDLTAQIAYDEQGSYIHQFTSLGVSMDLPFLNRNQGNIKSAKWMVDVNDYSQKSTQAYVDETVTRALEKAIANDKLMKNIDPKFESEFEKLTDEVIKNYMIRNLGLLDFLAFYDSYKQNALQVNYIKYNRVQATEDLNFYIGTNFFKN